MVVPSMTGHSNALIIENRKAASMAGWSNASFIEKRKLPHWLSGLMHRSLRIDKLPPFIRNIMVI